MVKKNDVHRSTELLLVLVIFDATSLLHLRVHPTDRRPVVQMKMTTSYRRSRRACAHSSTERHQR